jgi:hypothetical protein
MLLKRSRKWECAACIYFNTYFQNDFQYWDSVKSLSS